jgi:hypothetical protein
MPHDLIVLLGSSRTSVVEPQGQAYNLRRFELTLNIEKIDVQYDYKNLPPEYGPAPSLREMYSNEIFPLRIYIDRGGVSPAHVSFMSRPVGDITELHLDLNLEKNIIQFRFATHQPDVLVDGLVALGASVDMPGEEVSDVQDA